MTGRALQARSLSKGRAGRTTAGRSMGAAIMQTDFLGCLCAASQLECCCRDWLRQSWPECNTCAEGTRGGGLHPDCGKRRSNHSPLGWSRWRLWAWVCRC